MNRKQLILILVFLVIVGGAGLVLLQRNRESWAQPEAKMGDKVLPNFQPNDVAAIHIKGGSELHLARQGDLWRVAERQDYPANFHQISDVLIKMKDLKVVEADTVEPAELARVNLEEPGKNPGGGTLVEFQNAQGKVIASLLVGKKQMRAHDDSARGPFLGETAAGCYVRLPEDQKDVLVISDPLNALQPEPSAWLSRDFFKVEKPKSIALASTNSADSWKLERASETAPWTLADARPGEALDTNKLYSIVNAASYPRFVDILMSNSPAETGLERPNIVTFQTFDGFTYTLKIGKKSPEGNDYVSVAVTASLPAGDEAKKLRDKLKQEQSLAPWVYEVGSWILDPLTRERARLLQGSEATRKPANSQNEAWHPRVIQ